MADKNFSVLSFNVHGFEECNIRNVVNLAKKYSPTIIILQEVSYDKRNKFDQMSELFSPLGYIEYIQCANGNRIDSKYNSCFIVVISKEKLSKKEQVDLTETIHKRNCFVIQTVSNITIACVHLEIGKRFHHLPEDTIIREKIERENVDIRINQLEKLLVSCPDMIVGDFNFTPSFDTPEFEWLHEKGYIFAEDYRWTTPYNRVDMVFVRKGFRLGLPNKNLTIDCDLSDHMPILSVFE